MTHCRTTVCLTIFLPCIAIASTLVRRGQLETSNTDSSDLTTGGKFTSNSASGGCSSNTYYEDCTGVSGTRVYKDALSGKGAVYILNGDSVTFCGRWRRESNCQTCNSAGCTVTTPVDYGGTTTTSLVVSAVGKIVSLPISGTLSNTCTGVCTDPNDSSILVFPVQPSSQCTVADEWVAVNDDYSDMCAVKETCDELQVTQGCEDTSTGSLAGTYKPLSNVESVCNSDFVDITRSVYVKDGDDKYLFYRSSQNEWLFNSFCSSLGNSKGFFDAGDEPFINTEAEVQCYDGGYGSSKSYDWTKLAMTCKKKSGGLKSLGGLPSPATSVSFGKLQPLGCIVFASILALFV